VSAGTWKKIKEGRSDPWSLPLFLATKSGKAQAENFINSVTLLPGDLPPVLDIEQNLWRTPGKVKTTCQRMAANRTGILRDSPYYLYQC